MHIDEHRDVIQKARPHYISHPIKKQGGGYRDIRMPDENTKKIQKLILQDLDKSCTFLPCVKAFRPGTSILDNARAHQGNNYLIHYDLADFFDNITTSQVKTELKSRNYTGEFIRIVVKWCMYKNHLPQGAPTSPILSNLVCTSLDKRLTKLAKKLNAVYTRYADDIVISGASNILEYQNVFKRIIRTEHFIINGRKTYVTALNTTQVRIEGNNFNSLRPYHIITGLTVRAEEISLQPAYIRMVFNNIRRNPQTPQSQGKLAYIKYIDTRIGEKLENESNGNHPGKE